MGSMTSGAILYCRVFVLIGGVIAFDSGLRVDMAGITNLILSGFSQLFLIRDMGIMTLDTGIVFFAVQMAEYFMKPFPRLFMAEKAQISSLSFHC